MRKLSLDVDAIKVESFVVSTGAAPRGTVDGQQRETYGCETWTCPPPTQDSCVDTCAYSCDGNCGGGTGATCYSCAQTCDASCESCAVTCDPTCAWTCGSCLATCNYGTGPGRCCG